MIFGKKNKEKKEEKDRTDLRKSLEGWQAKAVAIISIIWGAFQVIIASGFVMIPPQKLRIIHLGFALVLCFFLTPFARKSSEKKIGIVDIVGIALAILTMGYGALRYDALIKMGGRFNQTDIIMGIIGTIVLFEAARRVVSPGLIGLTIISIVYVFFGKYFPEPFTIANFSLNRIVQHLYLSSEGIFGFVLGVSAEIIIVFVIFGSVLQEVGIVDFFYDFSNSIAGRSTGGAGKVAVLSSSLMGMVSGETSSCVAATGSFAIPLMKKAGYPADFAGAVETAASTGGQIMPPIMGATAFVIADSLGIPYIKIAAAALMPALMYYSGIFATVHFRSVKLGLFGLKKEELPKFTVVMRQKGYMILPLIGIVVFMVKEYTPTFAAFWGGIMVAVVLSFLKKETRLSLEKLGNILIRAARTAMTLAVACAIVGIIVGVCSITGITLTIADAIFSITGGQMLPALIMTAFVSLILGTGLPTTPAYVLTAISAAPVLDKLGLGILPAHLFVFYFGVLSALTPPTATGAYAAAGIAGANPDRVTWMGLKLALSGFIAPFVFVYDPRLVLEGVTNYAELIIPFGAAVAAIIALSAAIEGTWSVKLSVLSRISLGISSILLIVPDDLIKIVGGIVLAAILMYHFMVEKKRVVSLNGQAL